MLDYSIYTNLKHYTFSRRDDYLEELSERLMHFMQYHVELKEKQKTLNSLNSRLTNKNINAEDGT